MTTDHLPHTSELLNRAKKDVPTVTSAGETLAQGIDGVFVHKPPVHADHRGELVEMFTTPEFWNEDFAYAYQTSIRPGMLKGWFAHEQKMDRYHLVTGDLLVMLYDDRAGSPTHGVFQKLVLSESAARQVFIPKMVWHLSLNIGQRDAILVNLPTTHYNHQNPDRFYIPFDSGDIPVNVRSYFPVTLTTPEVIAENFC